MPQIKLNNKTVEVDYSNLRVVPPSRSQRYKRIKKKLQKLEMIALQKKYNPP